MKRTVPAARTNPVNELLLAGCQPTRDPQLEEIHASVFPEALGRPAVLPSVHRNARRMRRGQLSPHHGILRACYPAVVQ